MNRILFISLLLFTSASFALTTQDKLCLVKTLYRECRNKTCHKEWRKITTVIFNRSKVWKKYHFKATNPSICAIVSSREFSGRKLYNKPMLDKKVLIKIKEHLDKPIIISGNYIFFKSIHGKMIYYGDWRKV